MIALNPLYAPPAPPKVRLPESVAAAQPGVTQEMSFEDFIKLSLEALNPVQVAAWRKRWLPAVRKHPKQKALLLKHLLVRMNFGPFLVIQRRLGQVSTNRWTALVNLGGSCPRDMVSLGFMFDGRLKDEFDPREYVCADLKLSDGSHMVMDNKERPDGK